jgi:hypothetical protein
MSLIAFQTALGRSVRARTRSQAACDDLDLTPQERRQLASVLESRGFRTTANIQRSWCESRSAGGARLTLSILPLAMRRDLVREWVDRGGGTSSFFTAEAEAFLDFIAPQLPQPSHAFSLCRFEHAVLRAEAAAAHFVAPEQTLLDNVECAVRITPHAAFVEFFAGLEELLRVTEGQGPVPPLQRRHVVLVGPGVPGLARSADALETALWQAVAEPQSVSALLLQGHTHKTIETLWAAGAIAPA